MRTDSTNRLIILHSSDPNDKNKVSGIVTYLLANKQEVVKCGSETNDHFADFFSDPAYVFIVLLDNPPINDMGSIMAYCLVKTTPTAYEIWDVCVLTRARGSGIGSLFMKLICENVRQDNTKPFWLIVVPGNKIAASTYIKNGFVINSISNLNSTGEILGFPEPSIVFSCEKWNTPTDDIKASQILIFDKYSSIILSEVKKATINIFLSQAVIQNMNVFIKQLQTEVCGKLLLTRFPNDQIINDGNIQLSLPKTLIKGIYNPAQCNAGISDFSFHTHPDKVPNGRRIQIPSFGDLIMVTSIFFQVQTTSLSSTTQTHLLFVHDGIFILSLSPDFVQLLYNIISYSGRPVVTLKPMMEQSILKSYNETIQPIFFDYLNILENYAKRVIPSDVEDSNMKQYRADIGHEICRYINCISTNNIYRDILKETIDQIRSAGFKIPDLNSTPIFNTSYHQLLSDSDSVYIKFEGLLSKSVDDLPSVPANDPLLSHVTTLAESVKIDRIIPESTPFTPEMDPVHEETTSYMDT